MMRSIMGFRISDHAVARFEERYPEKALGMSKAEIKLVLRQMARAKDPTVVVEQGIIITILGAGMKQTPTLMTAREKNNVAVLEQFRGLPAQPYQATDPSNPANGPGSKGPHGQRN